MNFLDPRAKGRFLRHRGARVGLVLVGLIVVFAVVAPLFAGQDPLHSDFAAGATVDGLPAAPSGVHWLGTDRLYRDVFARLAYGARISLLVGVVATVIATVIGAAVGIVAGYYEGSDGVRIPWVSVTGLVLGLVTLVLGHPQAAMILVFVSAAIGLAGVLQSIEPLRAGPRLDADTALMRLVDVGLSFPFLLLVMALGAALDKTSVTTIFLTLGLTGWLGTARIVRAKTLQVRNLEFVLAARALGRPTLAILLRHILPNVAGPLVVLATASVAQMILAESALSYLGAGIAPPTPTWGHMLYEGQDNYTAAPWLLAAPAISILVTVLGFNLVGEGLRDALDPRAQ